MSETNALPELLTVGEIASYLRVSETTVWRWCSSGQLPAFRIGRSWRVRRSDLESNILRARAVAGPADAPAPLDS